MKVFLSRSSFFFFFPSFLIFYSDLRGICCGVTCPKPTVLEDECTLVGVGTLLAGPFLNGFNLINHMSSSSRSWHLLYLYHVSAFCRMSYMLKFLMINSNLMWMFSGGKKLVELLSICDFSSNLQFDVGIPFVGCCQVYLVTLTGGQ